MTVVVLALAALVSGPSSKAQAHVHVEPQVTFALPPTANGCGGLTAAPGGGVKVPLTVSVVAGQVAESVDVCIGGQGPYPFVLDSGAGQSTIDAGLAHRLHLAAAGAATEFAGVGCTGTAQPVSVGTWSLSGVTLAPQQLTAATLPQMGGKDEPDGLLGSDVLSRFGGVRIDFDSGALVLPGPEGAPLTQSSPYTGPKGPPSATLLQGESGTTVPLTVTPLQGDVSLNVAVRFAAGPRRDFVVDTGSSQSVVSSSVARAQSLAAHRPGPTPVHRLLGDHRAARPQWIVVRAGPGPPSPAHRIDELRHHQPLRHPGSLGLGPAAALRVGHPRLRRGTARARLSLPARCRQIAPSSMAFLIHGITSSSMSLSEVVASNPSTLAAFSVAGIRRATSCSNGVSAT